TVPLYWLESFFLFLYFFSRLFFDRLHPPPQRHLERSMKSCSMEYVGDKSVRFAAGARWQSKVSLASQTRITSAQLRAESGKRLTAGRIGFHFSISNRFPRSAR